MVHRISAATVLLAATATALVATVGTGVAPWDLVSFLADHGGEVHAFIGSWLICAPLVLADAWWRERRTPWVWVSATTLHLLALTVTVARFPHVVPTWAWPLLGLTALAGLTSVVTAFPAPDGRQGS